MTTTFVSTTQAQVGDYKFLAQMVKVKEIEFDWAVENAPCLGEEIDFITRNACTEWVVEVEGDETEEEFEELLTNQITNETGWCVNWIEYDLISA